jgi:hypothetical protein
MPRNTEGKWAEEECPAEICRLVEECHPVEGVWADPWAVEDDPREWETDVVNRHKQTKCRSFG